MNREEAENLKPGTLVRCNKHCRNSITIRNNGEYGVVVYSKRNTNLVALDVEFPNGTKVIFMPANWEVV